MSNEEKLQPTEQARKLIADYSADFLRTRMQLTREILENNGTENMTLTNYISGASEINSDDRKALKKYYDENIHKILVSDEEIEELVELVRESLTKYSIGNVAFSGLFESLIIDAFHNLGKNSDTNTLLNLKKWTHIAKGERAFAIDSRIQGRVSWRYSDEFEISDSNDNLVAKIGLDGTDKMVSENIERIEEDVLLASNIMVGYVAIDKGENEELQASYTVLLKKVVDGEIKYKAFYYDNNSYPEHNENAKSYALPVCSFNSLLSSRGLDYLLEDYYDINTFDRAFRIFNKQNSITNEEKEKMEKAIAVAVEWWADAIKIPTFDNGVLIQSLFATAMSSGNPTPSEEKIELFKKHLGNEIRAGLMTSQTNFSLSVDYNPDKYLYKAATKANLNTRCNAFPCKTRMCISPEEVSVSASYCADYIVLYSASMVNTDTDTMDGENGPSLRN